MTSGGICARETCDIPVARDPNFKYSQGDVYGLRESVYMPINDILHQTFSTPGGNRDALKRAQRALDALTRVPPNVPRGARPAIIMEEDDDDNNNNQLGLTVCVATTYGGEDISKLPRIFQHFSIHVASNGHISPDHPSHVHAPQWDRQNAYIIAWQFQSTATLEGVWTTQPNQESEKVVLGRDAMEFLVAECTKRKEKWEEMCKDPAVAAELEAELRKHVEDRQKQKHVYGATGSRTSSLNSLVSGIDSSWWRSTMRGPTIPEEPQDNVDPGTTGNPHAPEPWKVVSNHRPGSTYSVASTFGKKGHKDNRSIKSKRSFAHKPHNGSGIFNFDILRAVKVK